MNDKEKDLERKYKKALCARASMDAADGILVKWFKDIEKNKRRFSALGMTDTEVEIIYEQVGKWLDEDAFGDFYREARAESLGYFKLALECIEGDDSNEE